MLKILLLGTPEITFNDIAVPIQRRIPRGLFYYLAANPHPIGREELITMFWPEIPESSAREMFRDNLAKLRSALPDPTVIIANQQSVHLDSAKVACDVVEYLGLIDQYGRQAWQIPTTEPLPEIIFENLLKAIDLWRTPSFLTGVVLPESELLDDWVTRTGDTLLHSRAVALERLIDHTRITRDHVLSIRLLESALHSDPMNENLNYLMISELAASDARSEAIKHGEKVIELFLREYGENPSIEIVSLIQQLKTTKVPPRLYGSLGQKPNRSGTPFLGRKKEISWLTTAIKENKTILIKGEVGSGKSRLVNEFINRLSHPARVLYLSCHPSTHHISYQPLIDLVRTSLQPSELEYLSPSLQNILVQIAPELESFLPAIDQETPSLNSITPEKIRGLFLSLFSQISKHRKIILVIEDAQWIDEASCRIIQYLAYKEFFLDHAALFITAESISTNPCLRDFIDQSMIHGNLRQVDLQPFSLHETSELIAHILHTRISDDLASKIHMDTGGNPLLIQEIIKSNQSILAGAHTKPVNLEIPVSIHSLLRSRLNALSSSEKSMLSIIAIGGSAVSLELLEDVSQLRLEQVSETLESLENKGIVTSVEDSARITLGYKFILNILRETILLDMSLTRKRLLHRRVAHFLEFHQSAYQHKFAPFLAEHLEASGELLQAYKYWRISIDNARVIYAVEEEITAYEHIEYLLPLMEFQLSDDQINELFISWADLAYRVNHANMLDRIGQQLTEIGQRRGSTKFQAMGLDYQAGYKFASIEYQSGLEINEQALKLINKSDDLLLWLELIAHRSEFLYMMGRFEEGLQLLESEKGWFVENQTHQEQKIKALLHYDSSVIRFLMGEPFKAIEDANQAIHYYILSNNLIGQADTYANLVFSLIYCGDYRRAEVMVETGLAIARKIDYKRSISFLLVYKSICKMMLGKLDEAWQLSQDAINSKSPDQNPEVVILGYRNLGDMFSFMRDFQTACSYFQLGYDTAKASLARTEIAARLGFVYGFLGNNENSQRYMTIAQQAASVMAMKMVILNIKLYELVLSRFSIERSELIRSVIALIEDCQKSNFQLYEFLATRFLGNLYAEEGQIEQAKEVAQQLAAKSQASGCVWIEIMARSDNILLTKFPDNRRQPDLERVNFLCTQLSQNTQNTELQPALITFLNSIDKIIQA